MEERNFKLGEIVYHRNVYEHREPLKIVGIREDELELEGDYSGGTHSVRQKGWLPIKGVSRCYNHAYKEKVRKHANNIETLAIPCAGSKDNVYRSMMEMVYAVQILTSDITLNPEF